MWNAFVQVIEGLLASLYGVVGSWGLAIILFTVAIKLVTWPLTTKQIKSTKAMQELQPRMKALQEKYKDNKEAQTAEMMKLYQETGVNPMMGCFPMLIQFPIWIALYQAIINLANDGFLQRGFLFIPSLAQPNAEMGWWIFDVASYVQTWPYMILPILTVLTQILVSRIMTPTSTTPGQSDDPTAAMMKQMTNFMPFMFGVFALQFPAGLALYWVTNNVLTGIQYAVLNRGEGPFRLSLAPVAASGETSVIDVKPVEKKYEKGQNDGNKARRKRKKR